MNEDEASLPLQLHFGHQIDKFRFAKAPANPDQFLVQELKVPPLKDRGEFGNKRFQELVEKRDE